MALALAVAWLVALVVWLRWQRAREERGWPAWVELASEREAQYDFVRATLERQLADIEDTHALVQHRQVNGDEREARRLLVALVEAVELFVPDLVGRLREWSRVAAALDRVAPVPPLPVRALRRPALKVRATLWRSLDALLVTARERFRLRVRVLSGSLRLVRASLRRLLVGREKAAARWRRLEALHADLGTLSRASLATYRTLLVSLQVRGRVTT